MTPWSWYAGQSQTAWLYFTRYHHLRPSRCQPCTQALSKGGDVMTKCNEYPIAPANGGAIRIKLSFEELIICIATLVNNPATATIAIKVLAGHFKSISRKCSEHGENP